MQGLTPNARSTRRPLFRPALFALCLSATVLLFAADSTQESRLTPDSRVAIVRALSSEFARAVISLPRSTQGVVVDENGKFDELRVQQALGKSGVSVASGQELQITRIIFNDQTMVFEINGGPKKKRRWTEGLQVGIGGTTRPVSRPPSGAIPTGSYVIIDFKRAIPDVSPDDLKRILAGVLDFSRRSAAVNFVETLPPEFQEAVKNKQVLVGMDKETVVVAIGRPDKKIRERNKEGVEQEEWIYGTPPQKVLFVVFIEDKVVSVREF